jgi:8-oxo-dGTP pyrophosphatase MutT (NUDIX family)
MRIPRPPDAREGDPAPWHQAPTDQRRDVSVARVVAALATGGRDLSSEPPEPLDELTGVDAAVTSTLVNSAVLGAVFEEAGEARLILTRRAAHLRRHRGEVSFPGGRVEPGETPLAAAVREAHEEVGLDPREVTPVGWLRPLVTYASGSLIRPYVATLPRRPHLVAQPSEVERVLDVALHELLADGTFREERWRRPTPRAGADADGFFPVFFFEVDGETIWGATARILTELCCLVAGVAPTRR